MKFYKMFFTALIITATQVIPVFAQNEYFITDNNDTVKCKFTASSSKAVLRYKLQEDAQTQKVSTGKVMEYRMKDIIYAKRKLPQYVEPRFVQRIMRGKLSVYAETYPAGYVNVVNYFAGRDDNMVLMGISTEGFIGPRARNKDFVDYLIADVPEIVTMYEAEDSRNISVLLKTIRNYNLFHSNADVFFVNKRNDTTRCKILFGKDSLLLYKAFIMAPFKPLNTDSLQVYKLGSSLFYRQQLPEIAAPQFITKVIKGRLDAYADLKDNLYLSKEGAPLIKVKGEKQNDTHKEALFRLISDKPALVEKFAGKSYNDNNVLAIIFSYNNDKQ